jgi:hypothetical protein
VYPTDRNSAAALLPFRGQEEPDVKTGAKMALGKDNGSPSRHLPLGLTASIGDGGQCDGQPGKQAHR